MRLWIASRSLSSGAHSRDPLARNDRCLRSSSRPRRAADIDHVTVTGRRILVDEAGDQNPSVEGHDLAVLLAAGRPGRANVILAARTPLEAQLLRRRLIGQMHDDATVGAGPDHIRLFALGPSRRFRARAVIG